MEKAPYALNNIAELEKHLHGRGEGINLLTPGQYVEETPPRTWRRPVTRRKLCRSGGNTSTDVEKTSSRFLSEGRHRKHLHGRGEDSIAWASSSSCGETPPRTWRRPFPPSVTLFDDRNTSTDVEKTHRHDPCFRITWKHLHGRGEDCKRSELWFLRAETPPRTWRRHRLIEGSVP